MGVELYLKHIIPEQLAQMQEQGVASVLDGLYEQMGTQNHTWLLLDEHILGFMRHENPKHDLLYSVVMGGTSFPDSMGRDDYPRFFSVDEVKSLAQALENVTDDELASRFQATRDLFGAVSQEWLDSVPPLVRESMLAHARKTGMETDEQALARLQAGVKAVAQHYRQAAQSGSAMLLLLY
jgi:hypothetical protein